MSRSMALSQLLPDVALPHDVQVSGLVMDSRTVAPGDAFVAIAGFGAHGLALSNKRAPMAQQRCCSSRRLRTVCRSPSMRLPCPVCARALA